MLSQFILIILFTFNSSSQAQGIKCPNVDEAQQILTELNWLAKCRVSENFKQCRLKIRPKNGAQNQIDQSIDSFVTNSSAIKKVNFATFKVSDFLALSIQQQRFFLCSLTPKQSEKIKETLQATHQKEFPYASQWQGDNLVLAHLKTGTQYSYLESATGLAETQTDRSHHSRTLKMNADDSWKENINQDPEQASRAVLFVSRSECKGLKGSYCNSVNGASSLQQRQPAMDSTPIKSYKPDLKNEATINPSSGSSSRSSGRR